MLHWTLVTHPQLAERAPVRAWRYWLFQVGRPVDDATPMVVDQRSAATIRPRIDSSSSRRPRCRVVT